MAGAVLGGTLMGYAIHTAFQPEQGYTPTPPARRPQRDATDIPAEPEHTIILLPKPRPPSAPGLSGHRKLPRKKARSGDDSTYYYDNGQDVGRVVQGLTCFIVRFVRRPLLCFAGVLTLDGCLGAAACSACLKANMINDNTMWKNG